MKRIILLFKLLVLALSCSAQYDLRVEVGDVETVGQVRITIYKTAECWLEQGGAYLTAWVKADATCIGHTFSNLPAGRYGVAVFLDKNENREIDRNFIGKPKERYGFSNNFKPILRVPRFEDVAFDLQSHLTIEIVLN